MSNRMMKDSGIEWMGKIPENWVINKISRVVSSIKSGGTPLATIDENYSEDGILWVTIGDMSTQEFITNTKKKVTQRGIEEKNLTIYPKGTILYSIYATLGKVSELKEASTINQAILAIQNNENIINKQYLKKLLNSLEEYVLSQSTASTQFNLSAEKVKAFRIPLPPLHEQQVIATYLDEQVSHLDQLIQDQQQVIEDWKSYKQSLITETVTRGLNPEVEMKDSRIEWIGEIPSHWEVKKVKNCFQLYSGSTPKTDDVANWGNDLVWVTPSDFKLKLLSNSIRGISWTGYNSCGTTLVPEQSILITCRAPIGAVALAGTELCFNQGCKGLVPRDANVLENYFYYYFASNKKALNLLGRGTTFLELSSVALNNFYIPKPPLHEQQQIANFLDEKCSKIDQLIEDKQRLIEDLKAYKQSLIYECVTGKKEIV